MRARRLAALAVAGFCAGAAPETAQSLFDHGVALDSGGTQKPDAAAAFGWYRRAAEAGSAPGAFNVGVMYDAGRGVAHDAAQAATWYGIAAAWLEPRGAYNIAELYADGEGVPRNLALANAWYREAKRLGIAAASAQLRVLPVRAVAAGVAVPAPTPVFPGAAASVQAVAAGVPLVWTAVSWPEPAVFFIEVASLDGGSAKDVFSGSAEVSAVRAVLPAGHYAWRVFAADPLVGRYSGSGWVRFLVE